jgi:hypothetical protein
MTHQGSFWDRRKAAVEAEAEAEAVARRRSEEDRRAAALAEKTDAEILEEMGLPDPEAMQQGDDFAAFMSREVPERLRRKALRTLWRSNPVLACVDGLNDYDDDFTIGATGNGPIKTAYQVGKGMLYHLEEMARQAAPVTEDPASVAEEDEVVTGEAEEAGEVVAEPEVVAEAASETEAPAPRRMRFRFEEARA